MNEIIIKTIKNNLYYKGVSILKYSIDYPQIISSDYSYGRIAFNTYNLKKAIALQKYCENILFQEAKQLYEYNTSHGYPIMEYEILQSVTITYNQKHIVSLYIEEYSFTGGAHGNTIRKSQNWDLENGTQIPLYFFFPNDPYFILNILKQINAQIQKEIQNGNNIYFDNYCQLVLENFNPQNYYLNENKNIVVFFGLYEIAPYVSGIRTFIIT